MCRRESSLLRSSGRDHDGQTEATNLETQQTVGLIICEVNLVQIRFHSASCSAIPLNLFLSIPHRKQELVVGDDVVISVVVVQAPRLTPRKVRERGRSQFMHSYILLPTITPPYPDDG